MSQHPFALSLTLEFQVAPEWNRLVAFDARLPHGVSPVRGTHDPRRGRLVLTGWFSEPQTTFSGAFGADDAAEAKATAVLDSIVQPLQEQLDAEVRCEAEVDEVNNARHASERFIGSGA